MRIIEVRCRLHRLTALAGLALASCAAAAMSDDHTTDKEAQAKRRPAIYLTVFTNGYAHNPMPKDAAKFDKLLQAVASEGNFNAILCRYSPEREALCKKHGLLMMVDLLEDGQHVFVNPKECEQLCTSLRGNPTVAAYHLWSDRFAEFGKGRARDIDNVHRWDPTHATYSAEFISAYQVGGLECLAKSDFIGFYDDSWKRGPNKNFIDLVSTWTVAKTYDNRLGRLVETDPGLAPGERNFRRSLYLQNTSIACGLKCCLWFVGSRIMDMKTLEFNGLGKDVAKVNAWTRPLWHEMPRLGLPTAIYSTPVSNDSAGRDMPANAGKRPMPPGLEGHQFPNDFWLQPAGGEFVMGVFKYDGTRDAVYVANHDTTTEQEVVLKVADGRHPQLFNRRTGLFEDLPVVDGAIAFTLEKAGGAMLLFQ